MIEFQYLSLKNRPQFKDQTFDLSEKGVHLVLGYNKKTGSNNGVGKSLFFSELPSFLTHDSFGEVARSDKVRRGSVKFGVKKNGISYEIERAFSPKESISIVKDGVDLGIKDLSVAKDTLTKVIPYNEEEISSFLYLDLANGTHPLITGSTAVRKDFFRKFFKSIDALSDLKKVIDSHSSDIRSAGKRVAELTQSMTSLSESLPDDLDALRSRLAILIDQQKNVQVQAQEVSRAITLKTEIERLGGAEALPENLSGSLSDLKLKLKTYRSSLRLAIGHAEWVEEVRSKRSAAKKLSKLISETTEFSKDRVTELESVLEANEEGAQRHERLHRKFLSAQKELEAEIESLRVSIEKLSQEADTCPTCGAPYDNEHAKSHLKEVRSRLKQAKASLSFLEEPTFTPISAKKVSSMEAELESMRENQRASRELDGLGIPDEPDKPSKSADSIQAQIDAAEAEVERLEGLVTLESLVTEWSGLPRDIRRMAKNPGAMDELISIGEELSSLRVTLAKAEVVEEQIAKLRKERRDLRKIAKDAEVCDILSDAFAPNGVRREMISDVCGLLNQHVNQYASYAFSEDFKFEFDLDTQFSINVTRNFGKKSETTDIRKLSGAEKRLFSLVLVVTLLVFMKPADRPSLLILDEPTATMGEDNKANFIRFLPILNRVIPTIIVITPLKPHDYIELSPKVWTVVKDGSKSTIEPGVVDASSFRRVQKRS